MANTEMSRAVRDGVLQALIGFTILAATVLGLGWVIFVGIPRMWSAVVNA